VSRLRKLLGALVGVVAMATLMGVAMPAGPAAAEPECRWEVEPSPDCPPMPPRPPTGPRMGMGSTTMTPMPGGPVAGPGEVCRKAEARSGIVIRETGVPDKLVYTLIIDIDYCFTDNDDDDINTGIVTKADITSRTVRAVPGDSRLREISPTSLLIRTGIGGDRHFNTQQVFFRGCADAGNLASCRNFQHTVQVSITGNNRLDRAPNLFPFDGPLPPGSI
jgi:hypothetical protein